MIFISTRYFIILLKTKEEAKKYLKLIDAFLHNHLNLELNNKSRYYPNKMGIDFCGYRIFETHILIRERCKKKFKKLVKNWNKLAQEEKLNLIKVQEQISAFCGHIKHANTYNLKQEYLAKINFDFK